MGGLSLSAHGFFDDVPYQDRYGQRDGPWDPPVAEFPSAVATGPLVFAQTGEVAVAVIGVWAFQAGFEFWLDARFSHAQPPVEGGMAPQESVHVGVQFADGRKGANFGRGPELAQGAGPAGVALNLGGFGGGLRHRSWSYWASPLPSAGPVTFVCEWAAAGIPETQASLDAQQILDAARHSVQLWPGDGR
jgi:hypothetical protein